MSVMMSWALVICCTIIAVICGILIFHPKYVTGVVRTSALSIISLASLGRVLSLLTQPWVEVSTLGTLMYVGCAIFFVSHYLGFTGRAKRRGPNWYDPDRTQIMKRG